MIEAKLLANETNYDHLMRLIMITNRVEFMLSMLKEVKSKSLAFPKIHDNGINK